MLKNSVLLGLMILSLPSLAKSFVVIEYHGRYHEQMSLTSEEGRVKLALNTNRFLRHEFPLYLGLVELTDAKSEIAQLAQWEKEIKKVPPQMLSLAYQVRNKTSIHVFLNGKMIPSKLNLYGQILAHFGTLTKENIKVLDGIKVSKQAWAECHFQKKSVCELKPYGIVHMNPF